MNTEHVENLKTLVKSHTMISFKAEDIECRDSHLQINGLYRVDNKQKLLDCLGVRANLAKFF